MKKRYEEILNKEEFDAQMREQKQKRQERIVYFTCVGFAVFTCLAFAFLLVSFLFLNTCQVFSAKFSFVGVVEWLEGLPYVWIERPQLLKAQFIVGCIFFVFYLIIAVLLVVRTVKIIRDMIRLSDVSVNGLEPKELTVSIFKSCISCFTCVLTFIAFASLTTGNPLPRITVFLFVLFAILIVTEIVVKNLYVFYNSQKSTFYKKNFFLSLTRSFLLLTISALLSALVCVPSIKIFLSQLLIFLPPVKSEISLQLYLALFSQIFAFVITACCIKILTDTIKNSGLNLFEKAYDFYGKVSYAPISAYKLYRDKMRKQTTRLIVLSLLSFISEAVAYFGILNGTFVFPENGVNVLLKLGGYTAFIIFMAVAMKAACKIPVRYKQKLN